MNCQASRFPCHWSRRRSPGSCRPRALHCRSRDAHRHCRTSCRRRRPCRTGSSGSPARPCRPAWRRPWCCRDGRSGRTGTTVRLRPWRSGRRRTGCTSESRPRTPDCRGTRSGTGDCICTGCTENSLGPGLGPVLPEDRPSPLCAVREIGERLRPAGVYHPGGLVLPVVGGEGDLPVQVGRHVAVPVVGVLHDL